MNKKQIQLEVCKAMLDPNSRVYGTPINDKEFAVTTTGFSLFVFNVNECIFDIAKIQQRTELNHVCEDAENDVPIEKTKEFFVARDGKIIEKYKGENLVLYCFSDVSKPFAGYRFFANSPLGRVIAKDEFGRLVGVFMAAKFDEREVK